MQNINEIIKSAHFNSFLNGWLPDDEKINLYTTDGLKTAYWRYEPPHKIVVGNDITKNYIKGINSSKREYYVNSYYYHELAHAKYTEKNMKKLNAKLKEKHVPFKLFNLFEDARIEEKWRNEAGRKFKWSDCERINKHPKSDEELFFQMIQTEGKERQLTSSYSSKTTVITLRYISAKYYYFHSSTHNLDFKIHDSNGFPNYLNIGGKWMFKSSNAHTNAGIKHAFYALAPKKNVRTNDKPVKYCHGEVSFVNNSGEILTFTTYADSGKNFHELTLSEQPTNLELVKTFYSDTIKAQNSFEIIDICAKWLETHPDADNNMENIGRDTDTLEMTSIEHSGKLQEVLVNIANKEHTPTPYSTGVAPKYQNGDVEKFFSPQISHIDITKVKRLTNIFLKILKRGISRAPTEVPQKRLNIKGIATGNEKIYKKKMDGSSLKKRKKIALIMDCSGSMIGKPMTEGKYLLQTLNGLAKSDQIDCTLILSGTDRSNAHLCGVYPMPIKNDDFFINLSTVSKEGFASTVRQTRHILSGVDYVFIYTDGCIGDIPDKNYAHQCGIYTYGLYAGDRNMTQELLKYFDCAISRDSIEEVINALVEKIK